jgi:hypothetical protein
MDTLAEGGRAWLTGQHGQEGNGTATAMPLGAYSIAALFVRPITPCLVA